MKGAFVYYFGIRRYALLLLLYSNGTPKKGIGALRQTAALRSFFLRRERSIAFFLRACNARGLLQAARPGDFCYVVLEIGNYVSVHGA